MGRIDTTIGPRNTPAGRHWRFVRNMGTIRCSSMWRTGTPDCSSADSNVNEQPSRKATKSSRHSLVMSVTSAVRRPSR